MFPDDRQFYRAKILSYTGNDLKRLDTLNEELFVDVHYVDFGNKATVMLKYLREITPDLVDRLPKSYAINCRLDVDPSKEHNSFLCSLIEYGAFLVKCKNRVGGSVPYNVELLTPNDKASFLDLYKYIHPY